MVSKKNTAEISAKDIWENIWSGVSSLLDFFAVLENLGVVNDKLYVSGQEWITGFLTKKEFRRKWNAALKNMPGSEEDLIN